MFANKERYLQLAAKLKIKNVTLVAVSKTKPAAAIKDLYSLGQRDFGENYVQELVGKQKELPTDIRWHFIGHLQTNKVRQIIPFVHMIHGVDSIKLLHEIQKQAKKAGRVIDVLLQIHISSEETKFGLDGNELKEIAALIKGHSFPELRIRGLMGMASFTDNVNQIQREFSGLKMCFENFKSEIQESSFDILSMGMTSDYLIAIEEGSNMVRIGSMLFGPRT